MTKLWKAFRSVLPYPAFRVAFSPCLLRDCTRHSPDLQPSVYLPCLRSSVPSVTLFSAHPREIAATLPGTGFQSFFPPTQLCFPVDSLCQVMLSKESSLIFR